jgi:hypothetical protein
MAMKKLRELLRKKMEHKSNTPNSTGIRKPFRINEAHAILMGLKLPNDEPSENDNK